MKSKRALKLLKVSMIAFWNISKIFLLKLWRKLLRIYKSNYYSRCLISFKSFKNQYKTKQKKSIKNQSLKLEKVTQTKFNDISNDRAHLSNQLQKSKQTIENTNFDNGTLRSKLNSIKDENLKFCNELKLLNLSKTELKEHFVKDQEILVIFSSFNQSIQTF